MSKIEQGTVNQCCLTCAAYQAPDGGDVGLCFEARHGRKRAINVREVNACCYWHPLAGGKFHELPEAVAPVLLADRVFAALRFSAGGAPRCCREICDFIGQNFELKAFAPDVARILQHQVSCSRVVVVDGWYRWQDKHTWKEQVEAILDGDGTRAIRFALSEAARQRFDLGFEGWAPASSPSYSHDPQDEAARFANRLEVEDEERRRKLEAEAKQDEEPERKTRRRRVEKAAPLTAEELEAFDAKLHGMRL